MIETDKNGVKRIVQNDSPVPGSVASRNTDARFFPPAGKPWSVEVVIAGERVTVASGMTTAKTGKVFCLKVSARVTDRSEEPEDTA